MARCNCGGSCGCALEAGTGVTIGGTGSPGNPWVVNATVACSTVRACLSEGPGIDYDPVTGVISADISGDANNGTTIGTDGGLWSPAPGVVTAGCGLTGNGTVGNPLVASVVPYDFVCGINGNSTKIYCNPGTGQLRGEPRARTYTNDQVQEHTFAATLVPAGGTLVTIDNFTFTHTNPDPCRTMRMIVFADFDIDFDLPVGATAGFGHDVDRFFTLTNQGTALLDTQHFQTSRKVRDVFVPSLGTDTYTLNVRGERGTAGATFDRIQVQVHAIFLPD